MNLRQDQNYVSIYFTKLKTIWEELSNYRPNCSCGKYSCGGVKHLNEHHQMKHIMSFLMGLDDSFSQVRGQLLLMDPMPPINRVFSLIVQEQQRKTNPSSDSNNSTGTMAFAIHGYPPGYKFKINNNSNAAALQVSASDDRPDQSSPFASFVQNLSSNQYQQLMSMFSTHLTNPTKVNNGPNSSQSNYLAGMCFSVSLNPIFSSNQLWIIDSGATRHICSQTNAFISLHPICRGLILQLNLYGHQQSDLSTKRMIGRGDKVQDLYILNVHCLNSISHAFVNNVSAHIWHNRLGHISFKRLDSLKDQLKCDVTRLHKSDPYYICPLAKQRRLPFESNNHLSDNAPKLSFVEFFQDKGVFHQFSCVERPQQNSVVERKHQHLLNVARSLFFQSRIHISFWTDCILTAAFLINRTPTPLLKHNTPFHLFYKTAPEYTHFRVFGYLAFVSTLAAHRTKFQPRVRICTFLGYPPGVKGYKFYDIETKQVFLSRDAVFHEEVFPLHAITCSDHVADPFLDLVLPHSSLQTSFIPKIPPSHDLDPPASISGSSPSTFTSHSATDTIARTTPTNSADSVLQRSIRVINPPT
ncbi:hypothetical protein UlMin_009748 [Ulmus minor]